MAHVQIDRVISEKPPYEPQGKSYKIYEFICDGYIDGNAASGFTVKTLSGKARTHVQPGLAFDAEVDNFNGRTAYKIPRWMYAQGGPLANALHGGTSYNAPQQSYQQPAQQNHQQGGYQNQPNPTYSQPAQQPAQQHQAPRKPSGSDVLNMYCAIFDKIRSRYPEQPGDVVAAMTATVLIECQKRDVDVPVAAPAPQPRQQTPRPPPAQRPVQQEQYDDFPPDGDMSAAELDELNDSLPF